MFTPLIRLGARLSGLVYHLPFSRGQIMTTLKQLWAITGRLTGLALTALVWYLAIIGTIAILEVLI
jgi:hypothetical protein